MAKYSYEIKKQIVMEYLEGRGGYDSLTAKYKLGSSRQLRSWISAYKQFDDDDLKRSRHRNNYSFEKKLSVVESYLTGEISYQNLAVQEGITNPVMIANWVNRFRAGGLAYERSEKNIEQTRKEFQTQQTEERVVDTSAEHVKELEDEVLKLRIENVFLKELRRMRLEDEAKMRERRMSSADSEEN